jgi:hypothetical protein
VTDQADGSGFDLGVFASIGASLSRVASMMEDREQRRLKLFQQIHQVPILPPQITLTAGAGTLQLNDMLAPKAGYMWSLRRITANGFSAGTVTAYKDASGGEILFTFPSAGTYTFGRGEMLLDQNSPVVFVAAGITGTVQIAGAADNFERWLLPEYLN